MIFGEPMPFQEAIESRDFKRLVPTTLSTEQLDQLPAELREMAAFSAAVDKAEILQAFEDMTIRLAGGPTAEDFERRKNGDGPLLTSLAEARLEIKRYLARIGYRAKRGEEGTLKDLSTDRRIDLKLRTDVEMAQGYGHYTAGQNPTTLSLIPCQELVRISRRRVPRDWPDRWRAAGGQFFDSGRMIAAKDDPVWTNISRFGLPYPPFDFQSGMGVRNVRRPEAVRLGVISADQQVQPQPRQLSGDLQASAKRFSEALQGALEETGFAVRDGVLTLAA